MTASELKYLITIYNLCKGSGSVRLVDVAEQMNVSKVSVYKAVARLEKNGYAVHKNKDMQLTALGEATLAEYFVVINFMQNHLQAHCKVPAAVAYSDALRVVCAFSDVSRKGLYSFINGVSAHGSFNNKARGDIQ